MSFDLYQRRKELALTLDDVAKHVGVSKSTVKKWETGDIKNMKRDKILLLSNILQVSPIEFLLQPLASSDVGCVTEIHYRKNRHFVSETFSEEDFNYLLKTIELIKRNR